jgi:hypothetical protein
MNELELEWARLEIEALKELWATLQVWAKENDVDLGACVPTICIE